MSPEEYAVRRKQWVEIQNGRSLTVEIRPLSGNGWNEVGIRCSPEIWNALTNGTKAFSVRLKSSTVPDAEVAGEGLGFGFGDFLGTIPDTHYLFRITGKRGGKALLEINFPNTPSGVTRAELLLGKTPIDTKPGVN